MFLFSSSHQESNRCNQPSLSLSHSADGSAAKELPKPPSSGLLVPLSRGHSFLLVLIWPTCPQFAHFLVVEPAALPTPEVLDPGEPASPLTTALAFSRACRRSLLPSRRLSSASILMSFVSND